MAELTNDEIKQIVDVYRETGNINEVAKQTHHSVTTISKYLNKNKVYGWNKICVVCGKQFSSKLSYTKYCSHRCRNVVSEKKRSGCTVNISLLTKTCVVCGKVFKTYKTQKLTCSTECSKELSKIRDRKTREQNWVEYVRKRKEQAEQHKKIKKIEERWYKALHTVERECKYCGTLFYCLDTSNKQTCSKECSIKYSNLRKDKRIPKEQVIDTDINIHKLFKRDNGKCWICGEYCDFNDLATSKKGNIYPGDMYPEIEHVIPISRGGLHSWGNVRLAHHKCNAQKGASLYPYVPLDYEFAYKEKKKSNPSKKTAQYTLEGRLVKIWDSTGQIERELGLNSKHIQSVCRGDKSKTGNAYGYHWKYIV